MHRTNRLIKLLACLAVVFAAASATAAAATSGAVLTRVEYQELRTIQRGTKAVTSGHHGSPKSALAVCRREPDVSPLIRATKAECSALVHFVIGDLNVASAAHRCSKVKTVVQALNCLAPSFSALSADSQGLVASARRVARAATLRRFDADCIAALGSSKKGLVLLGKFAGDVRVLVTSMRSHNLGLFNVAIKHVHSLDGQLNSVTKPGPISVCPHG
jgi:hypothetical protein